MSFAASSKPAWHMIDAMLLLLLLLPLSGLAKAVKLKPRNTCNCLACMEAEVVCYAHFMSSSDTSAYPDLVLIAELLIQMDGLMCKKHTRTGSKNDDAADQPQVFVLAATNMPWELDMVRDCDTVHCEPCIPPYHWHGLEHATHCLSRYFNCNRYRYRCALCTYCTCKLVTGAVCTVPVTGTGISLLYLCMRLWAGW